MVLPIPSSGTIEPSLRPKTSLVSCLLFSLKQKIQRMHINKKTQLLIAGFLVLLFTAGCHNYYKATPYHTGSDASATLDSLYNLNRHFILRNGPEAFYMKNLVLSNNQKTLTALLDTVPPDHRLHLLGGHRNNLQYKKGNPKEFSVLSEVHLYTRFLRHASSGETVSLPLDSLQKIEVIEKDAKRTTNSYVIGAIGYTAAAFVAAAAILLATKSSCPFVSAYDGNGFALQGEIYGGAIYPQLARHDYLPLKMAPLADGTLQVKISNELKEKQFTDMADLWVITHDRSTKVLPDESGQLHTIAAPKTPLSATLNGNKDLLPMLQKERDDAVAYLDDTTTADATNAVVLRFSKEKESREGKLVLTLKNSYWLDLLYGELAKGFGSYYEKYLKKQSKKPAAQLQQWINDQHLALTVSVQTKAGWKKISDITTIGPLAYRTIVVPIAVGDTEGQEVVVKLSSGFMFWEFDYAALDFSPEGKYTLEKLAPVAATDEQDKDVLPFLQKEDNRSLEQPLVGNMATITYKPSGTGDAAKEQTYFLHAKGWYQHVRNFTNQPNVAFLKRFLKPNAFPAYGKALYFQLQTTNLRLIAAN
jgi:hypothetical protein